MKSILMPLTVCMTFLFLLNGCGGGGSSSTTDALSKTPSAAPQSPPPSSGQFSSLTINPLVDLGLEAGNKVCFSVKAINRISESAYSKAICSQIKDDTNLTLSWNNITDNVIGYYVYFGTNKNNVTNFIADVIES